MKTLPFDLIEDLADQEAGDLSPGADTRIRSQVRRLRVQFASEEAVTVPVRHKARVRIKGWRLEVVSLGKFRTVRAFKGATRFTCILGQREPLRAFLRFAPNGKVGAL